MFNFYLSEIGYKNASVNEIEENLIILNDIKGKEEDHFIICENFYDIQTLSGELCEVLFSRLSNQQFAQNVLPRILNSISCENTFTNLDELDNHYVDKYNSFWGAKFDTENERHINSKAKYQKFKTTKLREVTPQNFWERRKLLFNRIIFCDGVQQNIPQITNRFDDMIEKLIALDEYCRKWWTKNNFHYRDANEKSSLRISPESESTMNQEKLRNQRMFKLPNGRTECFELHMKIGREIRVHFFSNPSDLKIYIGYIGQHLPTSSYK